MATVNENMENNYFVGIGASAGGLEAINKLFDNMPTDTGYAFIVIQHLSPDYKSLMNELLSKHTQMQVIEAGEGIAPKSNCIYLIPPKKIITLEKGRFRLEERVKDHLPNTAIDVFFESLAEDKAERAIGIILSGTGTDGTKGIRAIKNNGGAVIVQDPATAQFDGMPNSAVASGFADLILSPENMGQELVEFIKEVPLLRAFNALTNQEEAIVLDILEIVFKATGHDFSNYKRPTINRRLAKRMAEIMIGSLSEYYKFLQNNTAESKKLCKEFLLHVTHFFRDNEAFEQLRLNVIPDLLNRESKIIKVWTVACSTGEEAYSLAMLMDEGIKALQKNDIEIKIFASDVSQEVIDFASRGLYSESQVASVSPERLANYFIKEANGYRINAALRKMIVFARHDISKDPPFSKIDLLTCRNMLIYMNTILQKAVLQKFHFAINDDGYLFLGPSENISILKEVLIETDKKWKIFRCISKTKVQDSEAFPSPFIASLQNNPGLSVKAKNALNNLPEIFKDTLLEEYDYAGIFIDLDFEVKQAMGNFKKFMEFPDNNFNFNLLKLVPTDLSIALSTGIRKAIKDNEKVVQKNVKVETGHVVKHISIIIKPYLQQKVYLQPFLFIILKQEEIVERRYDVVDVNSKGFAVERITELEDELKNTKENLQALIEEVESSNEELLSSNEEIVSANQELQSTNEELQSLNEELHTVNAEHQLKIRELIELNDDLNNYFRNTDIGQIIIDKQLIIRKFTPSVTHQVNLITTDIGRSILDISTNIKQINFIDDVKKVINSGKLMEREISMDEKFYLMRIAPYLKFDNSVDGVVVNFIDVTEVKKLGNILNAVLNSSSSGIVALQAVRNENDAIIDFEFITANKASAKLLGSDTTLINKYYKDLYDYVDPGVFDSYVKVVESGESISFEYLNKKMNRWFELMAVKMLDGLVITFTDINERKTATDKIKQGYDVLKMTSEQLQYSNSRLEQSNLDLLQFASVASHDLKEPLRKIQAFGNILKDRVQYKLDDAEVKFLDKVINSSNRMHVLIDDILTLSRLSNNETPYSKVDLKHLVTQITDDLEIMINEKNAKIEIEKLPEVKGIPGQMHQLFQNLISNAIKFNEGEPHIKIGEEKVTPELKKEFKINGQEYSGVYIQDNGIGFDEQFTEKIFGIFQRLESAQYKGTGIGLAIVKKIVDNHKGHIKVKTKPGSGARFTLLLPN